MINIHSMSGTSSTVDSAAAAAAAAPVSLSSSEPRT